MAACTVRHTGAQKENASPEDSNARFAGCCARVGREEGESESESEVGTFVGVKQDGAPAGIASRSVRAARV